MGAAPLHTSPLWLTLSLSPGVPESPRWLAGRQGLEHRATEILHAAARRNGRPPPLAATEVLDVGGPPTTRRTPPAAGAASEVAPQLPNGGGLRGDAASSSRDAPAFVPGSLRDSDGRATPVGKRGRQCGGSKSAAARAARHVASLLHPSLRATSLSLCAGWFLLSFTYFGCIFLTPQLLAAAEPSRGANATDDSPPHASDAAYATSLLATLAEVPGLLLATSAVNRVGRVPTVVGGSLTMALALGAMAISPAPAQARRRRATGRHPPRPPRRRQPRRRLRRLLGSIRAVRRAAADKRSRDWLWPRLGRLPPRRHGDALRRGHRVGQLATDGARLLCRRRGVVRLRDRASPGDRLARHARGDSGLAVGRRGISVSYANGHGGRVSVCCSRGIR